MNAQPRLWNRRRLINYPKQIEMAGGIAAPLLAGFSLTTVAQLVIERDHPWLSDWAIALFAIAAALLVYAMQFSAMALGYAAAPSDRLDYSPEAAFKPDILRVIRARQWEKMGLRAKYTDRTKYCHNFGLLAFLGGPRSSLQSAAEQARESKAGLTYRECKPGRDAYKSARRAGKSVEEARQASRAALAVQAGARGGIRLVFVRSSEKNSS
jgi:hypothetical protein